MLFVANSRCRFMLMLGYNYTVKYIYNNNKYCEEFQLMNEAGLRLFFLNDAVTIYIVLTSTLYPNKDINNVRLHQTNHLPFPNLC